MDGKQLPFDFLKHPSYHQVASFFLGFVFISCVRFTLHVPLAAVRSLRSFCSGRGVTHRAARGRVGPEGNWPLGDDNVHRWLGNSRSSHLATSSSSHSQPQCNNLVLCLTICLAMASIANFASLLPFDQKNSLAGCAFLIAWGGMAAQTARLFGLLKLSLDLRRLGVRRWETYLFWGCLVLAVSAMFAVNAISIGILRPLPDGPWALCFRKHFLPLAVVMSAIDIVLEVYCVIRLYYLIAPAFLLPRHKFDALLDVRMCCALSLLFLDLITAVPAAHFFNVLTDFLPASVGELLVLAAFNKKSPDVRLASTASIPGTSPDSLHSRSTIEIKKMSSTRSLVDSRPHRISHPFAASALLDPSPETEDWPESASPLDREKPHSLFAEPELAVTAAAPRRRASDQYTVRSVNSETESAIARSVKGAVVGFAFKDTPGSSRRQRNSFLSAMSEHLPTGRAEVFPINVPLRVPRPIVPPHSLHVEVLERASRYEHDAPIPSPTSATPPHIAVTAATPIFAASSRSTDSSRPSISISVPSNVGSHGSNNSTKSSLHLTPITPSQPSRRASSDESDWRFDARYDSYSSHPSSDEASSLQLRRNSGGSARLPPADDDLSIVYEASHEESDSIAPSRAHPHRPTFGEHMFVEGGIGRPISTPVGVPEDVQEGGHSNTSSNGSKGGDQKM